MWACYSFVSFKDGLEGKPQRQVEPGREDDRQRRRGGQRHGGRGTSVPILESHCGRLRLQIHLVNWR